MNVLMPFMAMLRLKKADAPGQRDPKERPQPDHGDLLLTVGVGDDVRAERQSIDQRVERKAERQAEPAKRMLAGSMIVMLLLLLAGAVMRMLLRIDEVTGIAVLV